MNKLFYSEVISLNIDNIITHVSPKFFCTFNTVKYSYYIQGNFAEENIFESDDSVLTINSQKENPCEIDIDDRVKADSLIQRLRYYFKYRPCKQKKKAFSAM